MPFKVLSVEQKAFNFLVEHIDTLSIKYLDGEHEFNSAPNRIWYDKRIRGDKSTGKIYLKNGIAGSLNSFYKIVHADDDIFIITHSSTTVGAGTFVTFDIMTNYDILTKYNVYLDEQEKPIKIERIE